MPEAELLQIAVGVWAYFGIIETQKKHSNKLELMEKDLTENTEFRIKWPRGQLRIASRGLRTVHDDRRSLQDY